MVKTKDTQIEELKEEIKKLKTERTTLNFLNKRLNKDLLFLRDIERENMLIKKEVEQMNKGMALTVGCDDYTTLCATISELTDERNDLDDKLDRTRQTLEGFTRKLGKYSVMSQDDYTIPTFTKALMKYIPNLLLSIFINKTYLGIRQEMLQDLSDVNNESHWALENTRRNV